MREIARQLREDVLDLEHIPPLSVTATRLLEIATDPELEVADLAAVIGQDPALCARILGLANSAFFAQSKPVLTVEEAIIRVLGLNMVRSLSLSMALAGSFDVAACPAFDLADYWLKSLASAALARDLALALRDNQLDPDTVYLCGLLHRLGEILLVHLRPGQMQQVYKQLAKGGESDFRALTSELVSVDDGVAGEWLAKRWRLPEPVVYVLGHWGADHEDCGAEDGFGQVRDLVERTRHWIDGSDAAGAQPPPLVITGLNDEQASRITTAFVGHYDELRMLSEMMT